MAGKGSKPGERRGGRKAGTPNKVTKSAREAFQHAFDTIGGPKRLASWAKVNPTEFYKLFARLIPQDVQHTGKDGGPIQHAVTGAVKWGDVEIPLAS
jgi:hypothetical protein